MKKSIILMMFALLSAYTFAQTKYATQNGHVWFTSKAGELIEAHNKTAAAFIDPSTGDIAFRLLIKSFKFEQALMEEHFNENYMESEKFPKAEFKGKITDLAAVNFSKAGIYKVVVEGDLTIHGVVKKEKIEGTIEVKDAKLGIKSNFFVAPGDFNIEIPSVVKDKIANSIEVNIDAVLDPLPQK